MSLSRPTRLLLGLGALAVAAFACGPFLPDAIIDGGDDTLRRAPWRAFRHALVRWRATNQAEFTARPAPGREPETEAIEKETIAAELADLASAGVPPAVIARHAARRETLRLAGYGSEGRAAALRDTPDLRATDGLPGEFADYHRGVCAYTAGETNAARAAFAAVLARPADERRYKSTWAAFMLGRLAAEANDPGEAARRWAEVRTLARAGFVDTSGLAAASLGREAQLHFQQSAWLAACRLYLAQAATGDPTAEASLRRTAYRALADAEPGVLAGFAGEPGPRRVITAALVGRTEWECDWIPGYDRTALDDADARWLAALQAAGVRDEADAATVALAAYRVGDFAAATRWLEQAPAEAPDACWLRAKLALHAGRVDEATALLAQVVRRAATADEASGWETAIGPYESHDLAQSTAGELGILALARRDYAEALSLLLRGRYWLDAAYVAERVLTTDELRAFVQREPAAAAAAQSVAKNSAAPAVDPATEEPTVYDHLRDLLARRLVREDRLTEAREFFPAAWQEKLLRFEARRREGRDASRPAPARALDLLEAARLLREDGLELRGTELAPDYAVWGGSFQHGPDLTSRSRAGGVARPSDDEVARYFTAAPGDVWPSRRFHYRQLAANLAWEACELLPDNTPELAAALAEAGGWIKARDPQAADRFYKALVRRCAATELGQAAAAKRWFP